MLVTAASASRVAAARHAVRRLATVVDSPGFKVAALDRGEPVTSITIAAKAGSRYETTAGLAHVFKNFAFKGTSTRSSLKTVRESELYGGVLSSALTREHVYFTAEFLRGEEKLFGEILAEALGSTRYSRHELDEEVLPVVAAESAEAESLPHLKAIELAHALAFRHGLGAPLYAGEHAVVSHEDLRAYARSAFSNGNVAVVGQGISADALAHVFVPHLKDVAAPSTKASTYHGGETRLDGAGPHTLFIGYGQNSPATPELQVLASYLEATPSVKWSTGAGPLAKTVPSGASVQTVVYNYSDAALLGFLIQAEDTKVATAAAKAVTSALKGATGSSLAADDVKAAVSKARFRAAHAADGRSQFAVAKVAELLSGSSGNLESSLKSLAGVNAAAITKAATALTKGKPTFVAIGDLHNLPYADEVGL